MAGKRIRAVHGPEEDRMRRPAEDRGARKRKMRMRERDEKSEGLSAKDAARMKAWEQT